MVSERQPRRQRGQFLVLPPGRAEGLAKFVQTKLQIANGDSQLTHAALEQLTLSDLQYGKFASHCGADDSVTEKFALGRVEQRMRREGRLDSGCGTAGTTADAASRH